MSPANTSEIIIAKISPLFFLLCMMTLLAIGLMKLAFRAPFRGSMALVFGGAAEALPQFLRIQ